MDFPYEKFGYMLGRRQISNVLMVGLPGVGKTTFFKTAISALSSSIQFVQNIGGGDGHVTKKITLYDFRDLISDTRVRVKLWDTWGITAEAFNVDFLVNLCKGLVPHGYEMQQYVSGSELPVSTA